MTLGVRQGTLPRSFCTHFCPNIGALCPTRSQAFDRHTHPVTIDGTRRRDRIVVLLAALSGATDAIGLIALGGAFTSVMTGNMVLVGVAIGTGDTSAAGLTLAAIGGYVAGVWVGARVAGSPEPDDNPWPPAVTRALLVELAGLVVFAGAWWSRGGHPPSSWFGPLLAVNALSLGVQSSAILRCGVPGLSTTYMTGTLTSMISRLAARKPLASIGRAAANLGGLIGGAGTAGLVFLWQPVVVPALQLALVTVAVVAAPKQSTAQQ
jgi:uncharacterized membrane protein YoaK (UPF0700 family)